MLVTSTPDACLVDLGPDGRSLTLLFPLFAPLQQRCAHEQPVIFYSLAIGWIGPVAVITVPSFRKNYLGWVPPEAVPTTYPREWAWAHREGP